MKSKDYKVEITRYLLHKGVRPSIKGFNYLRTAIEIVIENDGNLPIMTKYLYPTIAERYKTSWTRVERAIRHAIDNIERTTKSIHYSNSEFIATAVIEIYG